MAKLNIGKLESMVIKNVELPYVMDSKGYDVPIYAFQTEINHIPQDITIQIRAVKDL